MKILTHILIIAIFIISFSACERVQQVVQPVPPVDAKSEIAIGVVLPSTGHLALSGKQIHQALDLARNEINNAQLTPIKLKFIVEDDTGTPEGAVDAFNKLIHQDGMSVILGPLTSSATQVAFPIAQENQVVAISPTSGARGLSAIGDFVFRIALTTDIVVAQGIQTTHAKLGYQRVATLYDETDLFSTDRDETLRETLTEMGVAVLTTETFHSGDTDLSAQLARIQTFNPDVIFVSALPPEKPIALMDGHRLGIDVPFIVSSLTDVEVQAAGAAAENAITFVGWLSTDDTPSNQAFVENYTATYGTVPNIFASSAYAALYILAEAIANANSTDPIAIRDALANIKDLDTVLGKFSFDANGDAIYDTRVLIVKNGKLQPFE